MRGEANLRIGERVPQGNGGFPCQRMSHRRDDHEGRALERKGFELRRVARVGCERKVEPPFFHGFEQVRTEAVLTVELKLHGGVYLCAEIPHQPGDQHRAQLSDAAQKDQPAALPQLLHGSDASVQCVQRAVDRLYVRLLRDGVCGRSAGRKAAAPRGHLSGACIFLGGLVPHRFRFVYLAAVSVLRRDGGRGRRHDLSGLSAHRTPVFWVMLIMFIFANAAGTMMVSATSPIAQNQIGQSAMTAAMCVSIMTLANMCGRIGFATDFLLVNWCAHRPAGNVPAGRCFFAQKEKSGCTAFCPVHPLFDPKKGVS